jgi:DNA gyrase/topoisomerase IV subunit B
MTNNLYTDNSIESLDARDHVRLRSGMYIGSNANPNQLLLEVFSNALDEHNIGHGNLIEVSIGDDNHVKVRDYGQGFPIGLKREDGKTVLEASFSVINTSGKFSDDGVYGGSALGLNGIGLKLATFLSLELKVATYRDGQSEKLIFQDGLLVSSEISDAVPEPNGTVIEFTPDPQFFDSPKTDVKFFNSFFQDICCLCPDLTIELNGQKIHSLKGIEDLVSSRVENKIELIQNRFVQNEKDFCIALTFTEDSGSNIIAYVNHGYTESGPHISGLKTSITRILNNWARENGLLKEKDKNLDGNSVQEGMCVVCNIISKGVAYDAQTKGKVVKVDTSFLSKFNQELEVWLDNNPQDARVIIEKALIARKASEAAKKAREAVKNKKKVSKKVKILHPDKLKDAEFLGEESTLLVVEGLSAGASMAVARDTKKYGILMLRGKLINALSNKEDRLLKNEEIQLLFKALGIEPHSLYDPKELRYGKVAICVDSDSDGYHIALLIMAALQHFCPQFIAEKRLCWLRSPLFIVKNKTKEDYYFTDRELAIAKQESKVKGELQRCKGLGSLSATQAKNSMFGENQHLDVLVQDEGSIEMLKRLMESNSENRREFVFNNIDFSEVRE